MIEFFDNNWWWVIPSYFGAAGLFLFTKWKLGYYDEERTSISVRDHQADQERRRIREEARAQVSRRDSGFASYAPISTNDLSRMQILPEYKTKVQSNDGDNEPSNT